MPSDMVAQRSEALTFPERFRMRAPYEVARVAALLYSDDQGMSNEADLSAEQSGACAPARLPLADGDGRRTQCDPRASQPRPQEAFRVITLTKRRDFLAANSGKRAPMPGFVLLVRARDDGDPAMRVGYTVTKKIGNAVVRNRIKRRFRALVRDVLPASGVAGADHILIGRGDGMTRDFAQLKVDLTKALAKVQR
jgi:ribonuclease P protein component